MKGQHKNIEHLLKLVKSNDLQGLKASVKEMDNFDVNSCVRAKSGDSALHIASSNGFLDILRYLIESEQGNIELRNFDGKSPLHEAAHFSQPDVLSYLIEKGGNVHAVKKGDWTPLMLACTRNNVGIVEILLENEADPTSINKDGWNSYHIAAREGHIQVVTVLLKYCQATSHKGCSWKSKNGRTPIHTAVKHGNKEIVEAFLQHQSPKRSLDEDKDSCGTTPLMDACRFGHLGIIELLIHEFNSNLSSTNISGMNCLHIAAEAGQTDVIKQLIQKYQMNVNCITTDGTGLTALHFSVRENHVTCTQVLLDLGGDIHVKDKNGRSCIDLAILLKKDDVLKILQL